MLEDLSMSEVLEKVDNQKEMPRISLRDPITNIVVDERHEAAKVSFRREAYMGLYRKK